MMPCLPDHIGEARCPDCGHNHKEYAVLPEHLLTPAGLEDVTELDSIDAIVPIYRLHGRDTEGYYTQVVPAAVVISEDTVRVVWNNPATDDGWITVRTLDDVEEPSLLAFEIAKGLREPAMEEQQIGGLDVVDQGQEDIELIA